MINLLIIVLRAVVAVANALIAVLELIREFIDRNLKPKKIKKTPKNGCLFNTACVP
ncbi:hypothetical protein QFB68_004746 [Escherichia coli]|nr:hypothetical protein [Escherichia coli]